MIGIDPSRANLVFSSDKKLLSSSLLVKGNWSVITFENQPTSTTVPDPWSSADTEAVLSSKLTWGESRYGESSRSVSLLALVSSKNIS